ncbi:MAG: hypothetical protein IJ880_11170 [Bacilli bacterium]|nr:hypothetical protein [Bacilli bacterium]
MKHVTNKYFEDEIMNSFRDKYEKYLKTENYKWAESYGEGESVLIKEDDKLFSELINKIKSRYGLSLNKFYRLTEKIGYLVVRKFFQCKEIEIRIEDWPKDPVDCDNIVSKYDLSESCYTIWLTVTGSCITYEKEDEITGEGGESAHMDFLSGSCLETFFTEDPNHNYEKPDIQVIEEITKDEFIKELNKLVNKIEFSI